MERQTESSTVRKSKTRSLVGRLDLPPEESISQAGRPYVSFIFKDNTGKLHDCICIDEKVVPIARNLKDKQEISILVSQSVGDDKAWVKYISDSLTPQSPRKSYETAIDPAVLEQYNSRMAATGSVRVKINGKLAWCNVNDCVVDEENKQHHWLEFVFNKLGVDVVNNRFRIWSRQHGRTKTDDTKLINFNNVAFKSFKEELILQAQMSVGTEEACPF